MKKKFITIVAFFLTGIAACHPKQGIHFLSQNTSWKQLIQKAKQEQKPIFIEFYTTWCAPCKRMEKEIFPLSAVGKFFNSHYINVRYNAEIGIGKELNDSFKIQAYPALLFISSKGELVRSFIGAENEKAFIQNGEDALSKIAMNKPLSAWEEEYKIYQNDPQFILNYIHKRKSLQLPVKNEIEAYLKLLPKDSLNSPFVQHLVTWNNISMYGKAF